MKREILFGGKRIDNGEWVEGHFLKSQINNTDWYIVADVLQSQLFAVDPDTVGQWIGLVDKNGRKIFSGMKDKVTGFTVGWNQLHCCWGLFGESGFKEEIMATQYNDKGEMYKEWTCDTIEVID